MLARLSPTRILGSPGWLRVRFTPTARAALQAARRDGVAEAPRLALRAVLWQLWRGCGSVLDVGTGQMRSLIDLPCRTRLGLDPHRPYLEHRMLEDAVPVNASALDLEKLFVGDAVDLVTMMDVLEHLEREHALEALRQAEIVARR